MQITLSHYAGFCEGVARAYDIIRKIAKDPDTKKPIYVLGSLVHNADVVARIEKLGVRKIHVKNDLFRQLDAMKKEIGTLVITAHGMGPEIYLWAQRRKINLIDTTCPRVIKAQRLAQSFNRKKYQIVIVGDREHKETRGINEWAKDKGIFIEKKSELKKLKLSPKKKIAVISQTTQSEDFVLDVTKYIKKKYPEAEIVDTICLTTHNRQGEVKKLAQENDAVVVIGSPESANSNRLFEIAKEINPRSFFVERAEQLKKIWFKKCKKVGVTAGASTPDWVIEDVIKALKKA